MLFRIIAMLALGGALLVAQPGKANAVPGTLDSSSDVDFFAFELTEDTFLNAFVTASGFDSVLSIFSYETLDLIAVNDDVGESFFGLPLSVTDSLVGGFFTSGEYLLAVSEFDNFPAGTSLFEGYTVAPDSSSFGGGDYELSLMVFCSDVTMPALIDVPVTTPIPLPAGLWLLGAGLAAMAVRRTRA